MFCHTDRDGHPCNPQTPHPSSSFTAAVNAHAMTSHALTTSRTIISCYSTKDMAIERPLLPSPLPPAALRELDDNAYLHRVYLQRLASHARRPIRSDIVDFWQPSCRKFRKTLPMPRTVPRGSCRRQLLAAIDEMDEILWETVNKEQQCQTSRRNSLARSYDSGYATSVESLISDASTIRPASVQQKAVAVDMRAFCSMGPLPERERTHSKHDKKRRSKSGHRRSRTSTEDKEKKTAPASSPSKKAITLFSSLSPSTPPVPIPTLPEFAKAAAYIPDEGVVLSPTTEDVLPEADNANEKKPTRRTSWQAVSSYFKF
ncbi:hypothetical protein SAICODRAFT_29451 [Saitoella complicata NRRL Y-17804]|uniref:uncharacterized protein n=1 Tax=Saitoella complicata (strain BCRC 22490 / CBS 7301 / JCM 7358 / NBRC 10748 / NRRL Y-17804) TaxID=698492 RepID=UPI000867F1DF|nr:uncharacterized protein SAICODRAFT_29451 [Saitoella complicata NRRL Y-17804]ODQ54831.1 hypothetical protein SAICODRAFT_29451 [Saitoella complicata NRRL Y-17804]